MRTQQVRSLREYAHAEALMPQIVKKMLYDGLSSNTSIPFSSEDSQFERGYSHLANVHTDPLGLSSFKKQVSFTRTVNWSIDCRIGPEQARPPHLQEYQQQTSRGGYKTS